MSQETDGPPKEPSGGRDTGAFTFPDLPPASPDLQRAAEPSGGRRRRRRSAAPVAAAGTRGGTARAAAVVLRAGPLLLLLFAPLARGSVEPWSEAVVVAGAAATGFVWLLRVAADPVAAAAERAAASRLTGWGAGLHWPAAALLLLALLQWAPLGPLVPALSPGSAALHALGGAGTARLSVAPAETLGAAAEIAGFSLLFFAVLGAPGGRREVRFLAVCLLTLGFAHAVGGILWHLARGWAAYGLPGAPGTSFGPYVNRNHFANLMAMTIPLGAGYLLSLSRRRQGRRTGEERGALAPSRRMGERRPRQILAGFAVAVMVGALGLSLSRGGVASACVGLGIVALGAGLARPARSHGWKLAAAVAVSAAFAVWLAGEPLLTRLATIGAPDAEPSFLARSAIWGDTARLAGDFPLFGSGLGSFASAITGYQSSLPDKALLFAHNDWLQLLAEGGGAGVASALLLAGSFLSVLVGVMRRRRDTEAVYLAIGGLGGLGAFVAHGAAEFSLHVPANALWFTMLAAWTLRAAASRGE